MKETSKKATNIIKFLLPLIIENWGKILIYLSGITLTGIITGLGNFIKILSGFINIRIPLNIPLWLIVSIMPIFLYGIFNFIVKIIKNIKKPECLKFTSMEYTDLKNNLYKLKWDYELKDKKYVVGNIYAVCPVCDCSLTYAKNENFVYCPICRDKGYEMFDDDNAVKKIIWHRIKNGLY